MVLEALFHQRLAPAVEALSSVVLQLPSRVERQQRNSQMISLIKRLSLLPRYGEAS